jgi:hypothetical protein
MSVRLLGLPIEPPHVVINRVLSDLAAVARAARSAPAQLDQMLALGEEIAAIGQSVLEVAERLDGRAAAIMDLGERLDGRTGELIELGQRIEKLGRGIDARGGEIVAGANLVADTGAELIAALPTLERAVEMATPLEGAIDRFGRLVDRLPGGAPRRRLGPPPAATPTSGPEFTTTADPDALTGSGTDALTGSGTDAPEDSA